MSDGDPSLEEDIPKPLIELQEENVFTPKITAPIFTGSVKLLHKATDSSAAETESFLSDAQRNDLAFQQLFQDGVGGFAEVSIIKRIRFYYLKYGVLRDFETQNVPYSTCLCCRLFWETLIWIKLGLFFLYCQIIIQLCVT